MLVLPKNIKEYNEFREFSDVPELFCFSTKFSKFTIITTVTKKSKDIFLCSFNFNPAVRSFPPRGSA